MIGNEKYLILSRKSQTKFSFGKSAFGREERRQEKKAGTWLRQPSPWRQRAQLWVGSPAGFLAPVCAADETQKRLSPTQTSKQIFAQPCSGKNNKNVQKQFNLHHLLMRRQLQSWTEPRTKLAGFTHKQGTPLKKPIRLLHSLTKYFGMLELCWFD